MCGGDLGLCGRSRSAEERGPRESDETAPDVIMAWLLGQGDAQAEATSEAEGDAVPAREPLGRGPPHARLQQADRLAGRTSLLPSSADRKPPRSGAPILWGAEGRCVGAGPRYHTLTCQNREPGSLGDSQGR